MVTGNYLRVKKCEAGAVCMGGRGRKGLNNLDNLDVININKDFPLPGESYEMLWQRPWGVKCST